MDDNLNIDIKKLRDSINANSDGAEIVLGNDLTIYFVKTLIDEKFLLNVIKKPYYDTNMKFNIYFESISNPIEPSDAISKIYDGNIVAYYKNKFFIISDTINKQGRAVAEVLRESSFEGGTEGYVERANININLIRQSYCNENLKVEKFQIGTVTKNNVYLIYDNDLVDKVLVGELTTKIQSIKSPVIQSMSELQQHLIKNQWLLPLFMITQRPDRTVRSVANGKVAIILDGTATAMISTTHFHDFFHTVDDIYLLPIPSLFLIMLRYIALIVSTILPALYIAITSYNPEIAKVQLALSISSSRNGVPYSSVIEVIFMMLMMEFLVEASIRLPKTIGQTATTVGGLILGQAATQAHLVSNVMIIVVSIVAISNFIIPITSMNLAVRVGKYFFIFLAAFAGTFGLEIGAIATLYFIFSKKNFNMYYLDPISGIRKGKISLFFNKERS